MCIFGRHIVVCATGRKPLLSLTSYAFSISDRPLNTRCWDCFALPHSKLPKALTRKGIHADRQDSEEPPQHSHVYTRVRRQLEKEGAARMEDQNNNRWSQTHLCNEDEEREANELKQTFSPFSCAELH